MQLLSLLALAALATAAPISSGLDPLSTQIGTPVGPVTNTTASSDASPTATAAGDAALPSASGGLELKDRGTDDSTEGFMAKRIGPITGAQWVGILSGVMALCGAAYCSLKMKNSTLASCCNKQIFIAPTSAFMRAYNPNLRDDNRKCRCCGGGRQKEASRGRRPTEGPWMRPQLQPLRSSQPVFRPSMTKSKSSGAAPPPPYKSGFGSNHSSLAASDEDRPGGSGQSSISRSDAALSLAVKK